MDDISDAPLDVRRLRGLLAEAQIKHKDFAKACGLSRPWFCHMLAGRVQPGELARIKIARGLRAFKLDQEAVRYAS